MHHLDLGLFNYQITFTCNLLKDLYGTSIMNKIDKRLANIPRYPELKIFKHGIQSIARFTANEYRSLMKVMIFVLDNLIDNETLNKKLLKVYEVWNNMYIMSRNEEFDDNDLKNFEVIIKIFIEIRKFFNIFTIPGICNFLNYIEITRIYAKFAKLFL